MAGRLALLNVLASLMAALAVAVPALHQDVAPQTVAVTAIIVAGATAALQGALALVWWVLSDRSQARQRVSARTSCRSVRRLASPPEQ